MTSSNEPRIINEISDLNPEQKKNRKPDSALYTAKGSTERDSSYRERDNNRHGRGGRDNYSNNSQHKNLFTNNNRTKQRREFDSAKKPDSGTNDNTNIDNNSNPISSKAPPPVINHRSAILNQSTKSYERNVNNEPSGEDRTVTSAETEQHGRDHGRNNYRNNRNSHHDNRRNNENYDRGRGGRHQQYNRRDRDDRQYHDEYGSRGQHGSKVDLTASAETLGQQSGRRYRGSQSDLGRGQRGRYGPDSNRSQYDNNRSRNNRYSRESERHEAEGRRNSQSQSQYNRSRRNTEQSVPTEDPSIEDPTSNEPNDTASVMENELSEQMSGIDLNEQERTSGVDTGVDNDTSELILIDTSQMNSEYFSWSNIDDWSKGVDDDVWASSITSTSEQYEIPRDPSPPLPTVDTSFPPPSFPQDDKDWSSIRNKPQDDTSSNHSWNSRQSTNHNWSRGPRDNRNYRQQHNNSSGYSNNEYNDRYGEPKRKQYNNSNTSPGGRFGGGRGGGKAQFQGAYWELPPRLRKQKEQQQQRSNQQPPSSYARSQGQSSAMPPPGDQSYIGTHSDSNWSGESVEVRGNVHRQQDNRHYNSLPPPGRQRHEDGTSRGEYNRDRRSSIYETEPAPRGDYVHNSVDQTPTQSLPNPPGLNNVDQNKFNWAEQVEHEDKLEKLKSSFQVPEPPSRGRGRGGRGGFHGGRGRRDDRREYQHEQLDSRSSSRSSRRRRKSGSSVGSRRRSHSRDTVDTNISSTTTGTTRSRKNSDRSAASDKNWRERGAPQYEHSRSSEVANWRDRGNSSTGNQDWKSLRSGGRAPPESHSWRQPPPQISEEPPARQDFNSN